MSARRILQRYAQIGIDFAVVLPDILIFHDDDGQDGAENSW
jgi:hypothetical protein